MKTKFILPFISASFLAACSHSTSPQYAPPEPTVVTWNEVINDTTPTGRPLTFSIYNLNDTIVTYIGSEGGSARYGDSISLVFFYSGDASGLPYALDYSFRLHIISPDTLRGIMVRSGHTTIDDQSTPVLDTTKELFWR